MRIKQIAAKIIAETTYFSPFSSTQQSPYVVDRFLIDYPNHLIANTLEMTDVDEVFALFKSYWHNFLLAYAGEYEKIYNAMLQDYNPLENMHFKEVHHRVGTGAEGDTTNKNQDYSTTNYGNVFDSTPSKQTSKTEFKYDKGDPKAESRLIKDKTAVIDDTSYTGSENLHYETDRNGNIGIQSTQKYLNEEYDVRRRYIIDDLIRDFISRYCYYVGE